MRYDVGKLFVLLKGYAVMDNDLHLEVFGLHISLVYI